MKIQENYFQVNDSQANKIEDVLTENEQVLWRNKPNRKSYILSAVLKMMPIALIWLILDLAIIIAITKIIDEVPFLLWFLIPFFAIHLLPVWIWIFGIIRAVKELKNIEYAFTDSRIIVRSGIIGIDFKFINYNEIDSVTAKVGLVDKMCKVGDIYVNSKANACVIYDIESPYSLTQKLQKIAYDVKTDISYPNELRPKTNSGYKTEYTDNPFENK